MKIKLGVLNKIGREYLKMTNFGRSVMVNITIQYWKVQKLINLLRMCWTSKCRYFKI